MKSIEYFTERISQIPVLEALEDKEEPWVNEKELGNCWIWKLSCSGTDGRPVYTDRTEGGSTCHSVSRAIWRLLRNPDLTDKNVFLCHLCPNKKCVNPDHLYEGDAETNRNDEVARRRIKATKIESHIKEIVKLFKEGVEQQEIAKRIGVHSATIGRFLNGKLVKYTHNYVKEAEEERNKLIKKLYEEGKSITQIVLEAKTCDTVVYNLFPEIRQKEKGKETDQNRLVKSSLTVAERNQEIRKQRQEGVSVRELASKFGCSIPLIYTICSKT
jgi:transposase